MVGIVPKIQGRSFMNAYLFAVDSLDELRSGPIECKRVLQIGFFGVVIEMKWLMWGKEPGPV